MLSVEPSTNELLSLAKAQLLRSLHQQKTKPYLPVWGELFTSLRDIVRHGKQAQENILVYPMRPTGTLWYLYQENQFLADLPDPGITISMTQEQLLDALVKGSFPPLTTDNRSING
ncbi:hypothetical protein [Brevibacillus choshinensis]|uniref:hypothetical protein n=1 Tax=Brevibacillus choshinensis TaxID=54911 RepID=UPI002E247131|nr:hypothetical protein [Brevibacillus choshinensis]MED4753645.1 hypothetical protein [Brevibacillus choshinensis]MED4781924.1 hypothetical protein [Brevibacillus choshinensis]